MKNTTLLFESGDHQGRLFENNDLIQTVQNYSQTRYSAPWTLGHDVKSGDPAAGWVRGLEYRETPEGVGQIWGNSDFNEVGTKLIESGQFENKSISFYTPDSVFNPYPGCYSLRHVALLGAEPPAVKTLGPIASVQYSEFDNEQSGEYITFACNCAGPCGNLQGDTLLLTQNYNAMPTIEDLLAQIEELKARIVSLEEEDKLETPDTPEITTTDMSETKIVDENPQSEIADKIAALEASYADQNAILKAQIAELVTELSTTRESNISAGVAQVLGQYYSEGYITEEAVPQAALIDVVTKLTIGATDYAEDASPLDIIQLLLDACAANHPSASYGELVNTDSVEDAPRSVASFSDDLDKDNDMAIRIAADECLSFSQALTAIVAARDIAKVKGTDFSEEIKTQTAQLKKLPNNRK